MLEIELLIYLPQILTNQVEWSHITRSSEVVAARLIGSNLSLRLSSFFSLLLHLVCRLYLCTCFLCGCKMSSFLQVSQYHNIWEEKRGHVPYASFWFKRGILSRNKNFLPPFSYLPSMSYNLPCAQVSINPVMVWAIRVFSSVSYLLRQGQDSWEQKIPLKV